MIPRHIARHRAERLVERLGGAPIATSPTWRVKAKACYANGGYTNFYVSRVDARISAVRTVERPGTPAKLVYAFTESAENFKTLLALAMAVNADDDDLAWETAAPAARAAQC